MKTKKQKIFVGVSGGVDSSVAAYLLKKEGHEVHGVFVKTWSPEWLPCTWVEEKRDAMRVCAALDISFHFLDAEEEYKKGVADYMIAEYRAGRTPNPDVLCNRIIKFGALWDYARSLGADAIATGHYARVVNSNELVVNRKTQKDNLLSINYSLLTGADPAKDQSYFLWMLRQDELAHVRFPIGHLQKSDVRERATKASLFTAEKKDSQGICFLGDVDMREFLSHYIEQKKGSVLDEKGSVIGEHDGAWLYTIGERHGFRVTSRDAAQRPLYVVAKDIDRNTIIVSPEPSLNDSDGKGGTILQLREYNWLTKPDKRKKYHAQIRYHGEHITAKVRSADSVVLSEKVLAAEGQSVVLYDGEVMLGGGIIDRVVDLGIAA